MATKRRAELPHLTSALLIILLSSGTPRRAAAGHAGDLHPIVLVPGYSTNQIEVRLTGEYRASVPHCGERKGKGWFRLYLNATWLRDPKNVPCFAEQMSEIYDPVTNDYYNIPGVETRVPYFGSTRGFQYTDPDNKSEYLYMARLVERLEGIGYQEGRSLFGAPYDFRYAPTRPPHPTKVGSGFIRRTTALIEKASRLNGGRPVIVVTHSFGCQLMYFLLITAPPQWRQRYVKHFIPLAGPWGGGAAGMVSMASGFNFGLPFVPSSALRAQGRSIQTTLWIFPVAKVWGDTPLVITKRKNYTASDGAAFLHDVSLDWAIKPYLTRVVSLFPDLPAPGVPLTHIHGTGVPTVSQVMYTGEGGFGGAPGFVFSYGDGAVAIRSLAAAEAWARVPGQYLKVVPIVNATHLGMLTEEEPLKIIVGEVIAANK